MKKIILLIINLFFSYLIFSQNNNYNFLPVEIIPEQFRNSIYVFFQEDDYNITFVLSNNQINEDFGLSINKGIRFFDSGYEYISTTIERNGNKLLFNDYILEGKGFYEEIKKREEPISKGKISDERQKERNVFLQKKNKSYNQPYYGDLHGWDNLYFANDGIKLIKASSELKESSVCYSSDNLRNRFYVQTGDDPSYLSYDYITPPWVEGVSGYGIGEYLEIEFKNSSDEIQILNGFVDFDRQYLFKENSRVKTILIESQNPKFSKEYELLDFVKFTVIKLPQKTNSIRITIKDIYKGDKYDDTCLSAIVVTDCEKTSFKEKVKEIMDILDNSNYKDIINEFKKNNQSLLEIKKKIS